MSSNIFLKLVMIGALTLALIIPLALIDNTVDERQGYYDQVRREISETWTGEQLVAGPVLVVPHVETVTEKVWNKKLEKEELKDVRYHRNLHFFPRTLTAGVKVDTEERYRGIYSVPVYTANLAVSGRFTVPRNYDVDPARRIEWKPAFVTLGVSDGRGIRTIEPIAWQGDSYRFEPGSRLEQFGNGLHAVLGDLKQPRARDYAFNFTLALAGTQHLSFLPVADRTEVTMRSTWPDPSFSGRYLPQTRDVSEAGFNARWEVSHLATDIQRRFAGCNAETCGSLANLGFGVSFVKAVDIYSLTDRSLKYGLLFILLTFCIFFLFEVLKALSIHPVQYGLVGLALAVFYLLLVSLSEHIAFAWAYGISTLASVGLIGYYVAHVLKSAWRAAGFSLVLLVLYAMLLMILRSEDYALLMGSLLIFMVLAALMLLTRRIDWYRVGERQDEKKAPTHE